LFFHYKDEFGVEKTFIYKDGNFYDKYTEKPFDKDWYKQLKVDQQDLFTIPEVLYCVGRR
jgi:hypothetical protein